MGGLSIYAEFAYIYDKLVQDVDYKIRADYLEAIFKRFGSNPSLILDLGCGTGTMCLELSKRGYDMIGIDLSVDMLNVAKEKANKTQSDILFLNQSMTEFELYGTVDVILALLDSINYITSKRQLKKAFKLCNNYLNPKGLLIFDINTPYKLKTILGNNVFYEINDDITYIWQNYYNSKNKTCLFDLTFFVSDGEKYIKYEEQHVEKSYEPDELKEMLTDAGFEVLGIFDDLKFKKSNKKSERAFFVARKPE